MDLKMVSTLVPIFHVISQYHRHEIKNIGNIPQQGRCLVLANHSFATYDLFLLAMKIYVETGREPFGLADSNFFKMKTVSEIASRLNMIEANHPNAEALLNEEKIVYLAPGGMKEALRSVEERYQIIWDERKGFAKLAVKTGSPVVLAACPAADRIYEIYPNFLTDMFYRHLKLPFVFAKGLFKTPIPNPVKLVHYLSAPLIPPSATIDDIDFEDKVDAFHQQVVQRMNSLLRETSTSASASSDGES